MVKVKNVFLNCCQCREVKKENGVNKNVVKSIRHKECVNALFITKIMRHNMKRIQSKLHGIGTFNFCTISLSFLMIKDTY